MFVILPFEVDFYREHQVQAEYYGNPVLDSIMAFESQYKQETDFHHKKQPGKKAHSCTPCWQPKTGDRTFAA